MKRAIAVIAVMVICLSACSAVNTTNESYRIRYIKDNNALGVAIIYDSQTGVEYAYTPYGGLCLLVDADGKPLIYEGYEK